MGTVQILICRFIRQREVIHYYLKLLFVGKKHCQPTNPPFKKQNVLPATDKVLIMACIVLRCDVSEVGNGNLMNCYLTGDTLTKLRRSIVHSFSHDFVLWHFNVTFFTKKNYEKCDWGSFVKVGPDLFLSAMSDMSPVNVICSSCSPSEIWQSFLPGRVLGSSLRQSGWRPRPGPSRTEYLRPGLGCSR